jgi:hypothetical protein
MREELKALNQYNENLNCRSLCCTICNLTIDGSFPLTRDIIVSHHFSPSLSILAKTREFDICFREIYNLFQ